MNTRQISSGQSSALLPVYALALITALSACGGSSANSLSKEDASSASSESTPSPSENKIAGTVCSSEASKKSQSSESYVCTMDQAGKLVWLEASASKALTDKRAAEAVAKAAAEKAAAEAAAAEKAAAEKAVQDALIAQAAAEKLAADKAAQDAAAAQAAADAAARQAAVPPPAPAPAPAPVQGNCDPNYSGACVPIASDVDCAGGSGNGPAYVQGPVRVGGSDIYGLDGNDNDGIGCEG
jgi:hypothetical protein